MILCLSDDASGNNTQARKLLNVAHKNQSLMDVHEEM